MNSYDHPSGPVAQVSKNLVNDYKAATAYRPPASPDDALARKAAAEVEREEGFDRAAECRLHGAYDGDEMHRTALAAIRLLRERQAKGEDGVPAEQAAPLSND